jgi:hypothetical protein
MRKAKRVISKTKTYEINPWVDQFDAISQIMADTGEKESTVLRKLIDEALIARRRKIAHEEVEKGLAEGSASETLVAIQETWRAGLRQARAGGRLRFARFAGRCSPEC